MYWGCGQGGCKDRVSCGEKGISWSGEAPGLGEVLTAAADRRLRLSGPDSLPKPKGWLRHPSGETRPEGGKTVAEFLC